MIKCESLSLAIIFFLSTCQMGEQYVKNSALKREKRNLIFPVGGSKLLAICGFGVPVDLKSETVIFGTVLKANYRFPTNSSVFTNPLVTYERRKRSLSRWDLYEMFSQALEMRGFQGKSCLLLAICQIAKTPLAKNFGLYHELIHTILTPTTTREKVNHHSDSEYYAAQSYGRQKKDCERIFKDCSLNFLDEITTFESVM